jgi:hypothetical protein
VLTPPCPWWSYGTAPLPSSAEALDQKLSTFQFWFLICDGGCGGRPGRAGIEGAFPAGAADRVAEWLKSGLERLGSAL